MAIAIGKNYFFLTLLFCNQISRNQNLNQKTKLNCIKNNCKQELDYNQNLFTIRS